jgi:signal transduction histidine kinase
VKPCRNRLGVRLCGYGKGVRPGRTCGLKHYYPRYLLTRLELWLDRIGPAGATLVLCAGAAVVAFAVYMVLKTIEGGPITTFALINIPTECVIVAAPLILYSRRVIRLLARSRRQLEAMSRQLAVAAEQAQNSSAAKSAFLANMSHELRTPLNAILGFSEVIKDQHLGPVSNPRYLVYAGDIHASGQHLLGIINDVLDLAKIESGKMSLDNAGEFALWPALNASLTMLGGLGEKHGVTLRSESDDVRLMAVERMVHQIVINLVGNAVKFTPEGGSVSLRGAAQPDGGYTMTVRDTGIGMTESEITNALTPFGQNRAKMAVRHEGTGLGLPLANAMMDLHGGRLTVESQPNRGTCITLHFPPACVAAARRPVAAWAAA